MSQPAAIAILAHPDDIEFVAAGTLLLLKEAGYEIHYMTVANGDVGSISTGPEETARIRELEARRAAAILGAVFHPSLASDIEVLYEVGMVRRLTAVIRDVRPAIILTHAFEDYMEDHTNTGRLAVTAAFVRGAPNFYSDPPRPCVAGDVTIYHAMPAGLRDRLRRKVVPGAFVDTTAVHALKREALSAHRSQKEWLDASQGMDSYITHMESMGLEVGRMSGRFRYAEGWTRHLHLGFSAKDRDPLAEVLGSRYLVNEAFEKTVG